MKNHKTIAICSGYFNPLHKGHVDYLNNAKKLCDELIVIINSDAQVEIKGSNPFMDQEERKYIVSALGCVDKTIISKDTDGSVCDTLLHIFNSIEADCVIFANGGDRKSGNIPEYELCKQLDIKMAFNVGGEKTQSSSTLISKSYSN
jgi:D-beta-D-heptose 7-phosphate kinase/D-beta-D-heptose 1-phosphate adenosyltransferase